MEQEKIAILDLGTYTFHLLIAEVSDRGYRVLKKENLPVKIGERGIDRRIITKAAKERAIDAIQRFKKIIDISGVNETTAIATSAIRTATNGHEFIREVYEKTGINIKVISGSQEAHFIYLGVKQAVELGESLNLIMDIGGGSVEFIIGNSFTPLWKKSFEIGAQRLTDKFHTHDPVLKNDLIRLNKYLNKTLKPLIAALEKYKPSVLVGSSGTFDTLIEIYNQSQNLRKNPVITEHQLSIKSFFEIYCNLAGKNREQRLKIPGMIEMRVDMIVMSTALINFILTRFRFNKIKTSVYSLKEGILFTTLEKKQVKKLSA